MNLNKNYTKITPSPSESNKLNNRTTKYAWDEDDD
jgi:hypothetical protein